MSSKIVRWLVKNWNGKKSDLKKNLNEKNLNEKKSECKKICLSVVSRGLRWQNIRFKKNQNEKK